MTHVLNGRRVVAAGDLVISQFCEPYSRQMQFAVL